MGSEPKSAHVMDVALRAAVPMWLIELAPKDVEYLQRRASVCSQAVAEKGDVLMYGSKKAGAAGEVFNRLAEGVACLCLITKHPVPFGKTVFFHDKPSEIYETEEEANARVWPKMSKVPSSDSGPLQSETVRPVRRRTKKAAGNIPDSGADTGSQDADR